jgi:hypothetical protein|tara:strand:- start:449 stop:646 length:198 start_codon:yes stop_codon:yes gene_type:complete
MDGILITNHILKLINDKRNQISELLISNGVKDMLHYRHLMGNIEGLEFLEQELKSLLDKQELQDE